MSSNTSLYFWVELGMLFGMHWRHTSIKNYALAKLNHNMNNTKSSRHASTNQAQDPPTQPAETTAAFLRRIVQEYSLPEYLLKGSCYFLCGYIVLKTVKYATNTDIPIGDRERTVKALYSLLEFTWRSCNWSHRFERSSISKTSTTSKTSGISYRDASKHHKQQEMITVM